MTIRIILFVSVSCLIAFTEGIFVWINYHSEQKQFQTFLEQKAHYLDSLFKTALEDSALRMQQTATYIASIPEVQKTFYEGRKAVEAEGGGRGGLQAQMERCRLLSIVSRPWEELEHLYDTRQLHFQFGLAATSFLRVHAPEEFGDDLADVRFMIQDALRLKKPTMGFECGRIVCGIRGVVPITYNDPENPQRLTQIGVLEAGTSYQSLLQMVEKSSNAHFAVLLTLSHTRETMWPYHFANYLAKNPAVGNYFIESSLHNESRYLLDHPCTQAVLRQFGVNWCHIDQRDVAVAVFPLQDYQSQNDPHRAPVGAIATWYDVTNEIAQLRQNFHNNIIYSVVAFILIEIMLFIAFRIATRKLKQTLNLQTKALHELSIRDQLTNLYNRGYLTECLAKEANRVQRHHLTNFSLIVIDLDHFKSINEHFGYTVGDQVLVEAARLIRGGVRNSDYIFRYGGKTFLVILTDTPLNTAVKLCEDLRSLLIMSAISTLSTGSITASFGVAELTSNSANAVDQLLKDAEQALYQAKTKGRNCIEFIPNSLIK
ncbi:diguanylate cyclase [Chromatium okenii]|jgi:diguanylate cyclase (GGDEF)-like protein|uniref:sensor domain-containing diguanylate cyclase n=1 Tax=Chromatium okenii TaxID=61644 RepID=UPI0026ECA9D6|nr:diguanylate cyclase [Chromatium okenii]MBV5308247.1 diguanylate cyclase [Chromatium okenii]